MHFDFTRIDALPRLAWCARVQASVDRIRVEHGPWVEVRDDWFVAGAWQGRFDDGGFAGAVAVTGSGGCIRGSEATFTAATHPLERLYSLRFRDTILFSNSLAFLLERAKLRADPRRAHYFFELLRHYRAGLSIRDKRLRVSDGQSVELHEYATLVVAADLGVRRIEAPASEPPRDYADYAGFLQRSVREVLENAGDPSRRVPYRPVATISRGYDSTAIAALAARAGCREAVTFRRSGIRGAGLGDDSGTRIAERLGMECVEIERFDYESLPGLPQAEFYVQPFCTADVALSVVAPRLEGAVLLTGRPGENYWEVDLHGPALPLLQEPTARIMAGQGVAEFSLRVGCLHFPAAYCGALHASAIHRITVSDELLPWRIGGEYDRPVPRRLIEEAGVPREWFGQQKMGGRDSERLSPSTQADFEAFFEGEVRPHIRSTLPASERPRRHRDGKAYPFGGRELYAFHWGLARTQERYRTALATGASD